MTYQEIAQLVENFNLPYSYYQFKDNTGQEPPFVVFYYPGIDDLYADGINYQRITQLTIELYTDEKDFENEFVIEETLTEYGLSYDKTEVYIDDEKMHETIYTMEVVING